MIRSPSSCLRHLFASFLLLIASTAAAAEFEQPPVGDAVEILGGRAAGLNFRVVSPVPSDGLLRIYDIETSYGPLRAEGDAMLQIRLRELDAIKTLEGLEGTSQFAEGLRVAAAQPLEFVGDAIDDPLGAARSTVSGASRLFRRAASGVRNAGRGRDNAAQSLLGVSAAKRELAAELGVDPYTDYAPLATLLERAARASALGGLTVRGVLMLIPGGIGAVASTTATVSNVADLVKTRTPSELRDINRAKLQALGISAATIDLFLDNQAYTPADQTAFAEAIGTLGSVADLELFVVRAAGAGSRDLAVFQLRRAELLAHYHATVAPLQGFILVSGIPLTTTVDGRIVAIFPFDMVSWTDVTGGLAEVLTAELHSGPLEFAITGAATPLARSELSRLGWTVTEGLVL